MRHLKFSRVQQRAAADTIGGNGSAGPSPATMQTPRSALQGDLQVIAEFFAAHCRPGPGNPLSLLSAAQVVTDLPREQLLALRHALADAVLETTLVHLIEQRAATV